VKLPELTIATTAVITNIMLRTALSPAFASITHPINETRPILCMNYQIITGCCRSATPFMRVGQAHETIIASIKDVLRAGAQGLTSPT
jgi:hypothetical protein